MEGCIDVDRQGDVVVVRFQGRFDDAFEAYLERYQQVLDAGRPYAAVFVTEPDARMPSHKIALRKAEWMKTNRETSQRLCRGAAFILPSPLMRGFLRAVIRLQPLDIPHAVFREEDEAMAWVRGLAAPVEPVPTFEFS
ncbi:MAG: hypothetical protein AAGA54_31710 [Myxococcota bacterium]